MAPSPCPALQQWGSSDGAGETPLPWQCPPKAPLPQLCLSQRLWVPSWGLGQGWHHEPPHSPSPAMTLLGGKTAAWLVTGGQLGCHGDGGGGVSLLTQGECGGRKAFGELSPIPGCSTSCVLVGWAAWMLLHSCFGGSLGTCPASQQQVPSHTRTRISTLAGGSWTSVWALPAWLLHLRGS